MRSKVVAKPPDWVAVSIALNSPIRRFTILVNLLAIVESMATAEVSISPICSACLISDANRVSRQQDLANRA